MKNKIGVLIIIFISISISAQTDSVKYLNDSIVINTAEQAVQLIIQADSMALSDSINKAVLTKQLDELHGYETSKRKELEKELEEIQQKDSMHKAMMLEDINRLKGNAIGYPIIPHKDTLFFIYTKIGSLSPQERAEIVRERLSQLYKEFFVKTDSLAIMNNGQSIDLYYKDKVLVSITDLDALWFGKSKEEIVSSYKNKILIDIPKYKKDKSIVKRLSAIGFALLVILMQIALIKGINYLFRGKINPYLWKKRGVWFKGIKIKNYEILDQNRETAGIIFVIKLIRFITIGILLYLSVPILFSIFPPTQRIAETLFGYIITPIKSIATSFLNYIPELITIVVILVITRYVLKFLKFLSQEIENEKISIPGFFTDWAKPSYNIIKILILAFMFVVIFPYLPGSNSNIFKGVSIFIGVLFSLGSSSIISNMMAGIVITYMRPFKIGDRIKIGEVIGNVVEKTPFVTRIRTPKKEFITIPNSNILSSNVVNYSNSEIQGGLILHTTVTIGYDAPWRLVQQALINAAKKTANLNLEIAPFVLQTSLDDFYVSYQLNAHTNDPDKTPGIYSELHQNIQDEFNEAGIEILSPHYRAARDGNSIAVPNEYLPEGYEAPGFKIVNSNNKK
jgi:small-conductance mechanosensitive channel